MQDFSSAYQDCEGAEYDFPFAALHAQPRLQLALLLVAAEPLLGGLLIEGPRGVAKTTAARSLAALLTMAGSMCKDATSAQNDFSTSRPQKPCGDAKPESAALKATAQPAPPFVNVPLATTLEQLAGTLDLGAALAGQGLRFQPGLLARAHGGVLYVDEVNLLPDALIDTLLDASATGRHRVERDGIAHSHAARFALIGTMNPEEGPLRAQLLDRFGLHLRLGEPASAAERAAIVRTRLAFEADRAGFCHEHGPQQWQWAARLGRARVRLAQSPPALDTAVFDHVAELVHAAQPQGVRADLVIVTAARALAALDDAHCVQRQHIDCVAGLALSHRARAPLAQTTHEALPAWLGTSDAAPALPEQAPHRASDAAHAATSAQNDFSTSRPQKGGGAQNGLQPVDEGAISAITPTAVPQGSSGGGAEVAHASIHLDSGHREFAHSGWGQTDSADGADYAVPCNPWVAAADEALASAPHVAANGANADIAGHIGELPPHLRAYIEGAPPKKAPPRA